MSIGFLLLAHDHLPQAARLARHLMARGAPVVIHLDTRVARPPEWHDLPVIATQAAEWGMIGLVRATLDAARVLLARHPDLGHVALMSGACLPIRPIEELRRFLAAHPATDFIESVPATTPWVGGGLAEERLTLWHPFAWRRQRRLFDASVALQRRLRLRRRLPQGLSPHFGSQWWCLSAATLRGILDDPRLPAYLRFFRHAWIPDESFFQTLVRRDAAAARIAPLDPRALHAAPPARIDPRPLTLARFDARGQPLTFHDDHGDLLAAADHFFARKIDPAAHGLRARFLDVAIPRGHHDFRGRVDETAFVRPPEHRGLTMAGRVPRPGATPRGDTAAAYVVVIGAAELPALPGLARHGRLFGPGPAEFAGADAPGPPGTARQSGPRPADVAPDGPPASRDTAHPVGAATARVAGASSPRVPLYDGNLCGLPAVRDQRPEQFLARLVWADAHATPPRRTVFRFHPGDAPGVARLIARDANARLVVIDDDPAAILAALRGPGGPLHAAVTTIPPRALAEPDGWGRQALIAALRGDWDRAPGQTP